ncbi:prepilin-type N-terminal cleavage/methylation domain-containing protein [Bradyrhizobium yuanmingense]|uniref:prepilin-type N-terminal cleavage/methylation domain-containing protein n=1 Tax=Bradyrhizobium yuanmingense TaxID=108015 RepID=UPI0023B9088A|nr:prepilin-type N-terminal cleavage/methylation domain-containing protein [Bradyrhizobium yuanmingense]MDF0584154.1 prepilin-type N-terminal cleavage/methylation domain-containing protein [Bradyrhizobium yuanmingense]
MIDGFPVEKNASEAGFTLVEMLVGLVLTSLLAVLLLGAIRYGLTIRERTALRATAFDRVVAVQDFLRNCLTLAYPRLIGEANGTGRLEFEGTPTSIRFVAPAMQSGGRGGRSSFTIAMNSSSLPALVVDIDDPRVAANGRNDVLLANVAGVAFSYLPKVASGEARWTDRWEPGAALPVAIRVNVRFPPGDQRVWPELLIVPRIDVDVGCVLDDLTKRCRGR